MQAAERAGRWHHVQQVALPLSCPQPFIEREQPVRLIFPRRDWALAAPVLAGVGLFGTTLLTLGCFLVSGELRK